MVYSERTIWQYKVEGGRIFYIRKVVDKEFMKHPCQYIYGVAVVHKARVFCKKSVRNVKKYEIATQLKL